MRWTTWWRAALLAAAAVGTGPTANAAIIKNVSTGLDSTNALLGSGNLADAHWTVNAPNNPAARSVYPNNPDWFSGWLADGPSSTWIARDPTVTNNGANTYTTTFDTTGFALSSVSLSGSWAIDDSGILILNGITIGSLGAGAWGALTPFSVPAGSPLFASGVNTLQIQITATDNFLEGVRLQGQVEGTQLGPVTAPEPTAFVLATVGGLACVGARVRRRPRAVVAGA